MSECGLGLSAVIHGSFRELPGKCALNSVFVLLIIPGRIWGFIMHRKVLPVCTTTLAAAAIATMPTIASAHPGFGEIHDLAHGFAHPFSGLDHLIAMLAVLTYLRAVGSGAAP